MADPGPMLSKVYNQQGKGLTVVDKYGEATSVANVSVECFRSIVSTDNSQFGYVWKAKFYDRGGVVHRFFVPVSAQEDPKRFAAWLTGQTGINIVFMIKRHRKLWEEYIWAENQRVLSAGYPQMNFVEMPGLQLNLINLSESQRDYERWCFSPGVILLSSGLPMELKDRDMYWSIQGLNRGQFKIQPHRSIPAPPGDSKKIMETIILNSNPSNPEVFNLGLAAASILLHQHKVRDVNAGQFPLIIFHGVGKSQGKSFLADFCQWLTGDMGNGRKLQAASIENFVMRGSTTGLPTHVEEVEDSKLLAKLSLKVYDKDQVYGNSQGDFVMLGGWLCTLNKFDMKLLTERVTDRMAALVFTKGLSGEYSSQQQTLTDLQKSNVKPFEFMIGTVGDYIHSPQFKEDVRRWGKYIHTAAEGLIKERTCMVNYAPLYAMAEFNFNHFGEAYRKLGLTWDHFLLYLNNTHVPSMQSLHVETDNAESCIRRYAKGLLKWAEKEEMTKVMQHVRITYSSKIGCHSALGVSVSSNPVLKELMGVSTKLLKPHVLNQGGIWDDEAAGNRVSLTLLKNLPREEFPDELSDINFGKSTYTVNKRGFLIPASCLGNAMWCRFADVTGQTDKLNPRHVDIEANSGMSTLMTENPLESTGTGLGLHISASVIDHISAQESHVHNLDSDMETITQLGLEHSHSIAVQEPCQNSEELEMEQENVQEVASDDIEEVQDEPTLEPEKEKRSVHDYQEECLNEVKRNEEDCNEDGIDGEINLPNTASSLGKTFSCDECTFTERSKYAVSRHKRVAHKKTSFPCKYCDKVWSTSSQCNGHMSRCKRKAETDPGSSQTEASISDKDPTPAPPDDSNDTIPPLRKRLRSKHNSTDIDYICPKCSKSCKTLNGYNKHNAACNPQPPKDAVSLPVNGSFDCQQCDKTYKYKTNYDKHVKDKH